MIRLPRFPALAILMASTALASCTTAPPVDSGSQVATPPVIATPAPTPPAPQPVLSSCGPNETPFKSNAAAGGGLSIKPLDFTCKKLANGLRIYAMPDKDTASVSVAVWDVRALRTCSNT